MRGDKTREGGRLQASMDAAAVDPSVAAAQDVHPCEADTARPGPAEGVTGNDEGGKVAGGAQGGASGEVGPPVGSEMATETPASASPASAALHSPASASAAPAPALKIKLKVKADSRERAGPEVAKSIGVRAAWAAAAQADVLSERTDDRSGPLVGKALETVETVTEKWTQIVEERKGSFKKSDVDGKLKKWQQRAMYGQESRGGGLELSESFKAWYVAQRDRHRVELPEPVQAVIAEEATTILTLVKERYMRVLGPHDELVIKAERRLQEIRNRVDISDDNLVPLPHTEASPEQRGPSLSGWREK